MERWLWVTIRSMQSRRWVLIGTLPIEEEDRESGNRNTKGGQTGGTERSTEVHAILPISLQENGLGKEINKVKGARRPEYVHKNNNKQTHIVTRCSHQQCSFSPYDEGIRSHAMRVMLCETTS